MSALCILIIFDELTYPSVTTLKVKLRFVKDLSLMFSYVFSIILLAKLITSRNPR